MTERAGQGKGWYPVAKALTATDLGGDRVMADAASITNVVPLRRPRPPAALPVQTVEIALIGAILAALKPKQRAKVLRTLRLASFKTPADETLRSAAAYPSKNIAARG